ncbi:hypothetical protein C4K68_22480 [Pokkaliibacter plantistimulans]|uniref:DotM C-terminal cytoplasmic domain-containing protein n=1 Tax=Proteobacteria bacterium 228 TaxID=2083153 RepID=A0A2S5KKL4_9PROT|nr:hypothetical protein [Pokkaliibacter plantistimulans]PPC75059.1 hypothetical protein C4K68_22480 [Pokkaliibacter plantistimulans]
MSQNSTHNQDQFEFLYIVLGALLALIIIPYAIWMSSHTQLTKVAMVMASYMASFIKFAHLGWLYTSDISDNLDLFISLRDHTNIANVYKAEGWAILMNLALKPLAIIGALLTFPLLKAVRNNRFRFSEVGNLTLMDLTKINAQAFPAIPPIVGRNIHFEPNYSGNWLRKRLPLDFTLEHGILFSRHGAQRVNFPVWTPDLMNLSIREKRRLIPKYEMVRVDIVRLRQVYATSLGKKWRGWQELPLGHKLALASITQFLVDGNEGNKRQLLIDWDLYVANNWREDLRSRDHRIVEVCKRLATDKESKSLIAALIKEFGSREYTRSTKILDAMPSDRITAMLTARGGLLISHIDKVCTQLQQDPFWGQPAQKLKAKDVSKLIPTAHHPEHDHEYGPLVYHAYRTQKSTKLEQFCKGQSHYWVDPEIEKKVGDVLTRTMGQPKIKAIIAQHYYTYTVFMGLLHESYKNGIHPTQDYIWLRPYDRFLHLVLNQVGADTAHIESAGVFSHWETERKYGPVERPFIDAAIVGLLENNLADEEWITPDYQYTSHSFE